ncbi:hypothetical protein LCGC14_1996670, partial [marine sediment metagenome]
YLYAVIGDKVYRVNTDKTYTQLTGSLSTTAGQIYMAANANDQIMIVDVEGRKGHYVSGTTVTQITDADFITPYGLAFQNGYGIVTERDTQRFWLSGLNDFVNWDGLDFGTAEYLPDDLIACISDHNELWMFGIKTTEPFRNTGASDFPFERINNVLQEIGIGAPPSLTQLDNSFYFLDPWGNVRRMQGYTPVIVSTPQIAYQLSRYATISDMKGFGYVHEGHSFLVLTSPSENETWCYDAATNFWHKRSSWPNAPDSRWRANCYAFFNNKHLVGDFELGKIYELDHELYEDDGNTIPAVRRGMMVSANRKTMFLNTFELHIQAGVGLATGSGSDPQIMFKRSKDGGHTWGNEKWRSMGKIGEYDKLLRWKRLGKAKTWIPEITITDPVNRVIIGAYLDGTIGTK